MAGGLVFPKVTFYVAWLVAISRPVYSLLYSKIGPNARLIASVPALMAYSILLMGTVGYLGYEIATYK